MEYLHGNDKISKQRVPEDQLQQPVGGVFDALDQDLCRFSQLVGQHEQTHNQIMQLVILDQKLAGIVAVYFVGGQPHLSDGTALVVGLGIP